MAKQYIHQEADHRQALIATALFLLGETALGIPTVSVSQQTLPPSQQPEIGTVFDLENGLVLLMNHFINCLKAIENGFLGAVGVLIFQNFMDKIRRKYPKFGELADVVKANPEDLELQQALKAQAMTIFRHDEDARRLLSAFVLDEHHEEDEAMKKLRQARSLESEPAFVIAKNQGNKA